MPSSPQSVTTQIVFDYIVDTAGKPVIGARVISTLNFSGASDTSPLVNIGPLQQNTTTDSNGYWQLNLIPNPALTPTGTLYTISTPYVVYDISVPNSAGPFQSSSILVNTPSTLSPATTNLTGPITVTGNETVTGNLTVNGITTLGSTTTSSLTSTGAESVGGDLTIQSPGRLLFGAAAGKIVPGVTSISHRNNADTLDNLLITDAGNATVRNNLTVSGAATITGNETVSGQINLPSLIDFTGSTAQISGGSVSLSLRNNANTSDNVLVADSGNTTVRGSMQYASLIMNYKARAFLNGTQNCGNGVLTKVNLDTKTGTGGFDPNGNFDTSTNHNYTAPITGYYFVTGKASNAVGTVQNGNQAFIYVNGTERSQGPQMTSGGAVSAMVTDIISLSSGDTVDLRVTLTGNVNFQTGLDSCFLAIHYLST